MQIVRSERDIRAIEPFGVDQVAATPNAGEPRLLGLSSGDNDELARADDIDTTSGSSEQGVASAAAPTEEGGAKAIKQSSRSCSCSHGWFVEEVFSFERKL